MASKVRLGSLADIGQPVRDVFALPPKADISAPGAAVPQKKNSSRLAKNTLHGGLFGHRQRFAWPSRRFENAPIQLEMRISSHRLQGCRAEATPPYQF